jgi:hypothetical protein
MKALKLICILCLLAAVYAGCVSDNKTAVTTTKLAPKIVSGDFNGDGKPDTVTLLKPKLNKEGNGCMGDCTTYIKFSDTTIRAIKVDSCIGGTLDNLGDLNGDGRDEIGLLADRFSACWKDYLVYTRKNDEWISAVPPIHTHCNQWEAHIKPIEKDSLNKGYVVVHYSDFDNSAIVNRSKIIAIK